MFTWIVGIAARAQVVLEARRNHDDEHQLAPVHRVLHLVGGDQPRGS